MRPVRGPFYVFFVIFYPVKMVYVYVLNLGDLFFYLLRHKNSFEAEIY